MPTYPSPDDLKWVRERARQNIPDRQASFDKRVYISRQNAGRRKVVNMDEVSEVLDDFGFQIYDPGRLSFEDQIQIFSQAEIVVGPHGGGLMNMIFSDTSIIVELFANAEPRHHQFVLANLMDLDYEYLECETIDVSHDVQGHKDLMVDADDLRIILDHYIRNT
jgi:capsular polysaccharide biosynthesis protein